MKKIFLRLAYLIMVAVFLFVLCCMIDFWMTTAAHAQNIENQAVASQYGSFQVVGQSVGGFIFPPATCQIPAGGKNIDAFTAGVPIKIIDGDPSKTEIATPSSVFIGTCTVNMATTYTHQPPYSLTSGTGGLQEALLNAKVRQGGPNTIILDAKWYEQVQPRSGATVIAAAQGSTSWGLVDVTTTPYTYYSWNGSQYTATGGTATSVNYTQGATGSITRNSTAKWQDSISLQDFIGSPGTALQNTAALNSAVLAAGTSGKSLFIPAGTWNLDNSTTPALAGTHNVLIWGEGPASSFVCNTLGGPNCIETTAATGFGLKDLSISFGPTANARTSGYAISYQTCNSCLIENVYLNNGNLSGVRMGSNQHTYVKNLHITNFEANGMFTFNNDDLRVEGLTCANNGDACFETSWFDSVFASTGIPCRNITASDITSFQDTAVILVNSCSNVNITNWSAYNPTKQGVFIGQDPSTTTLHWPDRVSISNGTIYGAGYTTSPLNNNGAVALYINMGTTPQSATATSYSISGNVVTVTATNTFVAGQTVYGSAFVTGTYLNGPQFTIQTATGSSFTMSSIGFTHADVSTTSDTGKVGIGNSRIAISNVVANHIAGWGLSMAELQNSDLQLSNLRFHDVGIRAIVGCLLLEGANVNLDNIACSDSATYGLYDNNTLNLTGQGLVFDGSNKVGSGINAIYLSPTALGPVNINGVVLKDTDASTYRSSVFDGCVTSCGQHSIWHINSSGLITPTGPTSANGLTAYTYSDATHSYVFRNGGVINSYSGINEYLVPTGGATSSAQQNGAVFYYQSKCRVSPFTGADITESIGWLDLYPTQTTESFALNQTGGCGFPLTMDTTTAATLQANNVVSTTLRTTLYTVATLPSASALGAGTMVTVSDSNTLTAGTCTAGGSNYMIAVSNGTNWICR